MSPTKKNGLKQQFNHTIQPFKPRTRNQHAIANCKIFKLNDDCLLEVFSYLPTIDLCAMKDSCRRFNALANSEVQKRWKNKAFDCGYADSRNEQQNAIILKHFGHFVKNVMIMKHEPIFPVVEKRGATEKWVQLKHYTGLKKLTIFNANLNHMPICHAKTALGSLESMELIGCVGGDSEFARIINACKNLKYLRIKYGPSILLLASICHKMSNIESLIFTPELESNEFQLIVNEFDFNQSLSKLQRLQKIKIIDINCRGYPVTSQAIAPLAAKESLERVCLFNAFTDKRLATAFKDWINVQDNVFQKLPPTLPTIVLV